jgi:hypothetical protein
MAASAILWRRSHATGDTLLHRESRVENGVLRTRYYQAWSAAGSIRIMIGEEIRTHPDDIRIFAPIEVANPRWRRGEFAGPSYLYDKSSSPQRRIWRMWGVELFRLDESHEYYSLHQRSVTLPCGLILGLSAIVPAVGALRVAKALRRRRRRLRGFCVACGYDLRESTDRCPECGAPIIPSRGKDAPHTPQMNPQTSHPANPPSAIH